MSDGIAIFLCDRTGVAARPWAAAGYDCWCVDTQHSIRRDRVVCAACGKDRTRKTDKPCRCEAAAIHYVWGDARSWPPPANRRIAFMGCFPPCTNVAGSDARDFKIKGPRMLTDALDLFNACQQAGRYSRGPWFVENPVGVLSSHVRRPEHYFQPWEYAGYLPDVQTDNTCKKTCLWTGGGFVMPEPRPAPEPHRTDCWLASPDDDRGDTRSVTYEGFARAVFLANGSMAATEAA